MRVFRFVGRVIAADDGSRVQPFRSNMSAFHIFACRNEPHETQRNQVMEMIIKS